MEINSMFNFSNNSRTLNIARNTETRFASQGIFYLFGVVNRIVFIHFNHYKSP